MADKFVGKRTDIASSGAVAGDVIYLVDQGEVWDAVNTKLSLPGFGCIKISSGVWAVLNQVKSLNYGFTKPAIHTVAYKYSKGSIVVKDGAAYLANDEVPANSTFVTGTTGATWRVMTSTAAEFNDGTDFGRATATSGAFANVSISNEFKAKENIQLTHLEFKAIITRADAKVALFTCLSSDKKIKRMSSTVTLAITAGTTYKIPITPVVADTGDYIGMIGYGGTSGAMTTVLTRVTPPSGTTVDNWYHYTAAANPNIFMVGYTMPTNQPTAGWTAGFRYYYTKL